MFFDNNVKLLLVCNLVACIQAYSVSQMGDIRIVKSDDKWICDMIECPLDSERCFVGKSNEEPAVLKRVNICFSKDSQIALQKNSSTPIDPNVSIREYVNFYDDGSVSTSSDRNAINFDKKAFNEHMKNVEERRIEKQKNAEKALQIKMQDLEKKLRDMQKKLSHMSG